jgi:RHS repeat-associated protein
MRVAPVPRFWGPARKASRSGSGEQYTDGSPAPLNQTCKYTADDLSRIASVDCGNSTWAQTFSYDAFGNIQKSGTSNYIAAYSPVTNQVSGGPGYDANGNQLQLTSSIPWTSLTWNALNQPISVSSTTATYDALGRMVEKGSGGTYTQFVFRPSGAMLAVYSGGLVKGTVPLPGGSTAIYNAGGVNYIRHKDWLGSSRLATTWATHAVYSKEAYAPFGETYNEIGTPDRSFTGQDQNVATGSGGTGVYDFLFRKYDPSAGRWLSPDPAGWAVVNQADPQSINRYAYIENQPMNATDPTGLACVYTTSFGVTVDNTGGASGAQDVCESNGGEYHEGWLDLTFDSKTGDYYGNYNTGNGNFGVLAFGPSGGYAAGMMNDFNDSFDNFDFGSGGGCGSQGNCNGNAPNNGLPTPTNHKLTIPGTNYCGPGGNGTPTGQVDAACATHDACYQNAGVSWRNNVPFGPSMNAAQRGAIQDCDANLCRTLGNMSWPSSGEAGQATLVSTFFGCSGGYSLR